MLNLFYPSKRFCAACQSWDKYDEMEMSVILRPAKRYVPNHTLIIDELPRAESTGPSSHFIASPMDNQKPRRKRSEALSRCVVLPIGSCQGKS